MFPRHHTHLPQPSLQDFTFQKQLGKGSYGAVQKHVHKKTNLAYAIKKMRIKQTDPRQLAMFQKQIQVLYKIKHRNIVELIDHFVDEKEENLYLIMEYIQGTDLSKGFKQRKSLQLKQIATIVYQISLALCELHRNKIIHRDLKLENVIYQPNKSIKLVDLGCSNYFGDNIQRLTSIGTKVYYSPELLMADGQDDKLDVWCLGVLMYELIFLESPFIGKDMNISIQKLEYKIPTKSSSNSEELTDLIKKIFVYKYVRISAKQVSQHPWVQKNKARQREEFDVEKSVIDKEQMRQYKEYLLSEIQSCQKDLSRFKAENKDIQQKIDWCKDKLGYTFI